MAYEQIIYEVADNIATITLNRPEKLNTFTGIMMNEMIDAFDKSDADDNVRAVIVTGAGRAFCAGADLSAGPRTFDSTREDRADRRAAIKADGTVDWSNDAVRDGGGRLTLRIFDSLKPVIAAVNGAAVGVGVTMQLAMDVRLASENARFGFVFARRGIVPEACSSWFLPRSWASRRRSNGRSPAGSSRPKKRSKAGSSKRSTNPTNSFRRRVPSLARLPTTHRRSRSR